MLELCKLIKAVSLKSRQKLVLPPESLNLSVNLVLKRYITRMKIVVVCRLAKYQMATQ